jgi:hypothetical protein
MDLIENDDGSVTLYIGPRKPEGDAAKNWIPTVVPLVYSVLVVAKGIARFEFGGRIGYDEP